MYLVHDLEIIVMRILMLLRGGGKLNHATQSLVESTCVLTMIFTAVKNKQISYILRCLSYDKYLKFQFKIVFTNI